MWVALENPTKKKCKDAECEDPKFLEKLEWADGTPFDYNAYQGFSIRAGQRHPCLLLNYGDKREAHLNDKEAR